MPTVLDEFADATRPAGRVVITAMYTINVFLGYLLMLAAMTMDVGELPRLALDVCPSAFLA